MRAIYLPELIEQESYVLIGDPLHHLVNVVRVEIGEDLLLINGLGLMIKTKVDHIAKKELHLLKVQALYQKREFEFDLALGIPKRDALELCLKEAVEIGFRKIFLIRADFSQIKVPETDRLQKLLISALEQSNSAYLPSLVECSWQDLPWSQYSSMILMDSQIDERSKNERSEPIGQELLIIGPEGGFSSSELQFLRTRPLIKIMNLPTPIMRTPTALAVGAGIMLQRLMDR